MPPFVVLPCTMDDGPALARNCVPAFWEDPDWAHIWTNVGKTCEYVTSQSELRWSHNLLLDPDRRRNLKAVDEETGEVVGYVRYIMPLVSEFFKYLMFFWVGVGFELRCCFMRRLVFLEFSFSRFIITCVGNRHSST